MDNSSLPSTPTSTEEDREQRWPDEVSPKPALTFAVLWDPVEGMVTFSGPQLLDTDNSECSSVFEDKPLQKACDDGPKSRYEDAPPLHVRTFLHRSPRYKHGGSSLLRTSSTFERKVRNVPLRPARSLHNPRANKVEASISESNNLSPPVGILRSWTQRSPRKGGLREESLSWRSGTWVCIRLQFLRQVDINFLVRSPNSRLRCVLESLPRALVIERHLLLTRIPLVGNGGDFFPCRQRYL